MIKKLNIGERLMVMSILPKEGDFVTLRAIRDMVAKIGLSAKDMETYDVTQKEGVTRWNKEGLKLAEIDFEVFELEIITSTLKKLNEDKKLTPQLFDVYEKFME